MTRSAAKSKAAKKVAQAGFVLDQQKNRLICEGDWTIDGVASLEKLLCRVHWPSSQRWVLDTSGISRMDTVGAWLLYRIVMKIPGGESLLQQSELPSWQRSLLDLVIENASQGMKPPVEQKLNAFGRLGLSTVRMADEMLDMLRFIGETSFHLGILVLKPWRIRFRQIFRTIQMSGVNAVLIVGLISFLMGVVIAYQGGMTLERFGANFLVVELVSLTMLREMSPLLAAIIVAGRTGSAYTAEIGTMQVTDEIDALRMLGITPIEMLVIPKVTALLIALPLLTVYADITGIFGGMVVARWQLDVGFYDFISRLPQAVSISPKSFWVGLIKAPVFAMIIAIIGCYRGFKVDGSSESVGRETTASVVASIFLVILVDAVFSILFTRIDW